MTLQSAPSGPPGQQPNGGPSAVDRIDVEMADTLVATAQPQGLTTRLALLDSHGQVMVQSDRISSSDPVDAIDQYLPAGDYSLSVVSIGGQGTYTLTTMLQPAAAPFQPIPVGSSPDAIVTGDFRGDGRLDLAVADFGNQISGGTDPGGVDVLLSNGDGTFQLRGPLRGRRGPGSHRGG